MNPEPLKNIFVQLKDRMQLDSKQSPAPRTDLRIPPSSVLVDPDRPDQPDRPDDSILVIPTKEEIDRAVEESGELF